MAEVTAIRNNALPYPIYAQSWTIVAPLLDADGDPISPSSPDSEVSKNGDTFADCTNEAVEIATSSGVVYLTLTAAEMTADIVAVRIQSTGAKTTIITLYPRKLVVLSSGTCQGSNDTSDIQLASGDSAIDDAYNGCLIVAVIDSTTEARIINDYVGSTKVAEISPAWNTAQPDSNDTYTIYLPEGRQIDQSNVMAWLGTAPAAYSTTRGTAGTALPAAASNAAGGVPVSAAGGLDLDARLDAAVSSRMATYTQPTGFLSATFPAGTVANTTNITAGTVTTATNVTTVNGLAAGVITAASIATGAIDADALATDAVEEIRNAITGGAYDLDTDANGRIRIVDGTGTGELDTLSGTVLLRAATQASIDAILADSNELQTDWVDGGRLDLLVDAIKAKTDSLTFTVANKVDSNIASYAGSSLAPEGLPANIISIDTVVTATPPNVLSPAAMLKTLMMAAHFAGVADSGSTTTLVDSSLGSLLDNDHYKGSRIIFTDGDIAGQCRLITAFTASADRLTFAPATTQAVGTNAYIILPAARVDVHSLLGTVSPAAAGYVAPDWSQITNPTSTVNLSGTTIKTATDVATDTAAILIDTNELQTDLTNGGRLDLLIDSILADTDSLDTTKITTARAAVLSDLIDGGRLDLLIDAILADTGTDGVVVNAAGLATDAVQEIRNAITGGGYALNTDAGGSIRIVDGTGTGEINTSSGSVPVYDFTTSAKALLQVEAEDALIAHRLDELLNADSDIDGAAPPTVGSVFHELLSKTAGSFTFDQTTDSLEALRDRGDAAWITATGFSTLTAADIRTAVGLGSANLDTQLDALPTAAEIAAGILDLANGIETGLTPRNALRLITAAAAGKLSGAATTTLTIRNAVADSKDRISATVDASGNRSAITLDLT